MKRTNVAIENQKPHAARRTNPIVEQAVLEIKEMLEEDGYATAGDYLLLVNKYQLPDEILLPAFQQSGLGFVKTSAINGQLEQEVIVDLRVIAAAMLLVYSDDEFALKHSVLDYLKALHSVGTWYAAFPLAHHKGLLEDIYGTYGHHFSDMRMADAAELALNNEAKINRMAERHVHAITELTKSDAELTEVYHLCLRTMDIVNNATDGVRTNKYDGIQHRKFENVKAYNHFWRLAVNKILSPRPRRLENIQKAKE